MVCDILHSAAGGILPEAFLRVLDGNACPLISREKDLLGHLRPNILRLIKS